MIEPGHLYKLHLYKLHVYHESVKLYNLWKTCSL